MNGQWRAHVLLWIGSAIAISVVTGWALVQSHSHPKLVTRTELMQDIAEMKRDIRELRNKQEFQLDAIIQALEELNGNPSWDPDY